MSVIILLTQEINALNEEFFFIWSEISDLENKPGASVFGTDEYQSLSILHKNQTNILNILDKKRKTLEELKIIEKLENKWVPTNQEIDKLIKHYYLYKIFETHIDYFNITQKHLHKLTIRGVIVPELYILSHGLTITSSIFIEHIKRNQLFENYPDNLLNVTSVPFIMRRVAYFTHSPEDLLRILQKQKKPKQKLQYTKKTFYVRLKILDKPEKIYKELITFFDSIFDLYDPVK